MSSFPGPEQPAPTPNGNPLVKDALIADIEVLCARRAAKYGTHLQPGNGRDALQDAYEELVDGALYLKQLLMERDQTRTSTRTDIIHPDGTHTYWSTHCRHGQHSACSATEMWGRNTQDPEGWSATIARKPAQCKTCAAPCICDCHQAEATS